MRYVIKQKPNTESFYIEDIKTGQHISLHNYKYVIDIIDDKYVIVGRDYIGKKYGLITVAGLSVVDMIYDAIYVKDNRIYCQLDGLINEMTLLGQYVWHNKQGEYFSNEPLLSSDIDTAIIKDKDEVGSRNLIAYKAIDCFGHIIEKFQNTAPIIGLKNEEYLYSEWGDSYHIKWRNLWDLLKIEIVDSRLRRTITFPNGLTFENLDYTICFNRFLLLYTSGYNSEGRWVNTYYCVAEENCNVLYYDFTGFSVNQHMFPDRLVINNKFILDVEGNLYSIPNGCEFAFNSDRNGYIEMYNKGKRGYMNNRGEIVIPCIYEIEKKVFEMDEDYEAYLRSGGDFLDAFDGDSSAIWNID